MTDLNIVAIDPDRLAGMRRRGADEHGNDWTPFAAGGWEPMRCCLSVAVEGVPIVLISYQPLDGPSPWAEVGPVFVHAHDCAGYASPGELPPAFAAGPRLLRTYHADGSLDYEHIRIVDDGEPLEPVIHELFDTTSVSFVHARSVQAQCFTFAVHRA
jgi:hypothetical protein